jgi:hypothetical protein
MSSLPSLLFLPALLSYPKRLPPNRQSASAGLPIHFATSVNIDTGGEFVLGSRAKKLVMVARAICDMMAFFSVTS